MRHLRLNLRRGAAFALIGFLLFASALMSAGDPARALASTPYDNVGSGIPWLTVAGQTRLAQSFSTGTDGLRVTSVSIRVRNANYTSTFSDVGKYSVSIWSSAGNTPSGLLTVVVTDNQVGQWGDGVLTHSLSSPLNLEANTKYYLIVSSSSGTTIGWYCNTSAVSSDVSPPPTFTSLSSSDSGTTWSPIATRCVGNNFAMKVTGTSRTAPTLSNFANISANVGDAPATIVAPTTAVAGTFAYSSSDPTVATVSGDQLAFVGVGTTSITATFSPTDPDSYTTATISMTVTVAAATTSSSSSSSSSTSAAPETIAPSTTAAPTKPARTSTTAPAPQVVTNPTTTTSVTPTSTTTSSTSTSTTIPRPTTTPPAAEIDTSASPAPASDNIFGDNEASEIVLRINSRPGDPINKAEATVRAVGLIPGAPVTVTIFSEPRILLESTADAAGNFSASVDLPDDLGPGRHTLLLSSRAARGDISVVGALEVADDGTIESVIQPTPISNFSGPGDARVERAVELGKPLYDPRSRPLTTASIVVAATGLIALAGASGMSGSSLPTSSPAGRGAGRASGEEGQRRRNARGKLAGAVTKKLKGLQVDGEARGDASRTWRTPGTQRADAISASLPNVFGKWSALAPRVVVDGSWLRAMFGSLGWITWVFGVGLGLLASFVDTRSPLTPTFGLILVIAVLGILDAGAGAVGWFTIVVVAATTGKITGWPDVRTALGLGLVFATVPLLAHVIRPLRRYIRGDRFELWERVFDYVMMPVFVSFATGSMLKALNGLSGLEIVTSDQVSTMRWFVGCSIIARLALEDLAAHFYPRRMAAVQPKKLVSPGRTITATSIGARSFIFLMVAEPFFGLNARTIAAAGLLALPLVLKMWEDDLPNSTTINKWLPRGLFRFLCTLILGAYLTSTLIGPNGGDSAIRSSFIWMMIPGVALGIVELFGRSGGDWPNVALKRGLGALVWVMAAGIVTGHIILFA